MALTTRDRFLESALRLFAERGFYGVSLANIADDVGLTKQALLHHFPSKEKIYGEVLKKISDDFDRKLRIIRSNVETPSGRLKSLLMELIPRTPQDFMHTRLLMRELLDNQQRADRVENWYLRPLLRALREMAKALPGWRRSSNAQAMALVYQLLGAVNYFAVSEPTLRGVLGDREYNAIARVFAAQFEAMMAAVFAAPPDN